MMYVEYRKKSFKIYIPQHFFLIEMVGKRRKQPIFKFNQLHVHRLAYPTHAGLNCLQLQGIFGHRLQGLFSGLALFLSSFRCSLLQLGIGGIGDDGRAQYLRRRPWNYFSRALEKGELSGRRVRL